MVMGLGFFYFILFIICFRLFSISVLIIVCVHACVHMFVLSFVRLCVSVLLLLKRLLK
jgi:hypothetical protein